MKPRVLSLCDRTGVMIDPWLRAGFPCTIVDIQHQDGTDGLLTRVGRDIVRWLPPIDEYGIVFAFPPCTHLAKSGARWFRSKGLPSLIDALTVVNACREICEWAGAPYMVENPSGSLSTYWRKPDHSFDPIDYGGYVIGGENFTKLTCLWTGNGFVMPPKKPAEQGAGPNPIHYAAPGPDRGDRRSITPRGFAKAVFLANLPVVMKRRNAA